MKIKTVTIGVLAGAIFGMAAHAGDDNAALTLAKKSVVSKAYADDSFQTKIPATASGLSDFFGDAGTLVAATGTDGVVAPRLILPGYRDAQSEFGNALSQQTDDYGYWTANTDEYSGMIDDMYHEVTGEPLPYNPKYSIPSLELVKDLTDGLNYKLVWDERTGLDPELSLVGVNMQHAIAPNLEVPLTSNAQAVLADSSMFGGNIKNWNSSRDGNLEVSIPSIQFVGEALQSAIQSRQSLIPAAPSVLTQMFGAGTLVAATDTDGVVAPRLIIGGYRNGQTHELARAIQQRQRDLSDWTMNDFNGMVDDIYHQATGDSLPYEARYSVPSIELLVELINMLNDKKQDTVTAHAANAADSVLTDSATAGTVQKRAIYDGSATYVANTNGSQIPTMGAVASYVETHSPTIPAPTGDCLNAANHCALVTTYANGAITYAWTVMAK